MLSLGIRICGARFQNNHKWGGELDLRTLKHKYPFMLALSQAVTEHLLTEALEQAEAGPFANYVPYTHNTGRILEGLAQLKPETLAIMHGSSFIGDGAAALRNLSAAMEQVVGPKREQ